jgi:hypothetical protein
MPKDIKQLVVVCERRTNKHDTEVTPVKYSFCCSGMKKAIARRDIYFLNDIPGIKEKVIVKYGLSCGDLLSTAKPKKGYPHFKVCDGGYNMCISSDPEKDIAKYAKAAWSGLMGSPKFPPHTMYIRKNDVGDIVNAFSFSGVNYCPYCGAHIDIKINDVVGQPWEKERTIKRIKKLIAEAKKDDKWLCCIIRDTEWDDQIFPPSQVEDIIYKNYDSTNPKEREIQLYWLKRLSCFEPIDPDAAMIELQENIDGKIKYLRKYGKNMRKKVDLWKMERW